MKSMQPWQVPPATKPPAAWLSCGQEPSLRRARAVSRTASPSSGVVIGGERLVERGAPPAQRIEHRSKHNRHEEIEDHGIEGGIAWKRVTAERERKGRHQV